MKTILLKLLDYLKYPSTYKGLVALLGVAGVALKPELTEAITTAGVALYGVISLLLSDSDVKK